jgi:hypothetical protein
MSQLASSPPPRVSRHLDQARRNYALYQRFIAAGQDLDWALTFLYYTAVHMVEALGASRGKPIFGVHPAREGFISTDAPAALCAYMTLHNASTGAKYKLVYPTEQFVRKAHDQHFRHVQNVLDKEGIRL